MKQFEVNATTRELKGKGASRRLRHADNFPAIIYGANKDPVSLTIVHNEMLRHMENEAFYSHILTVNIDGTAESAILKDVQRHPSKPRIMHIDFQRVSDDIELTMQVPLHFTNEIDCPAVKLNGGLISHEASDVEIRCLPKNLPEFIEVDLAEMDINDVVHLSDLKLPEGVTITALEHGSSHDLPVAHANKRREEEEEDTGAPVAPEAPTEGDDSEES
jgi:large subunit ribosomal protein L25